MFDFTVGFLAVVGLVVIITAVFFLHYKRVDRKKTEQELYK